MVPRAQLGRDDSLNWIIRCGFLSEGEFQG
jgi:hypothetical protein